MKDMLKGQVAIVAGGTSGMGEATARFYAREGAVVVIGGTSAAKGEKVKAAVEEEGGVARFYAPLHVENRDECLAIAEKTLEEFGRIDILADFAGRTFDGGSGLDDDEVFARSIGVNLKGAYNMVNAVVPHMKERRSGKIILCSSNGAFNPTTPAYEYHMAKGGVESLTVNLAMELAPLGIRVNCINPGPIATPFWDELFSPEEAEARKATFERIAYKEVPLNRMGTPEDIAGVALFFASELSAFVTGLRMYVGGGCGYIYAHGQSALLSGPEP